MIEYRSLDCPPPSSRGLGRDPFKVKTGVRIPVEVQSKKAAYSAAFSFNPYFALAPF